MPSRHRLGLTLLANLVVVVVGCGDDGPTEVDGLPTIDGAPELVVVATDFQFEPAVIEMQAGEPVNIVLEVTDGGHNLGIARTEFLLPIVDEGERTTGGLVIDEPGTYQLLCTVPGHVSEGMVGSVEVRA